jgi:hypothetical protein
LPLLDLHPPAAIHGALVGVAQASPARPRAAVPQMRRCLGGDMRNGGALQHCGVLAGMGGRKRQGSVHG